jgi:predicted outer membrane protein
MLTYRKLLVAGLLVVPLAVLAQQTGQRRNQERPDQPGKAEVRISGQQDIKSSQQLDKHFVSCLKSDNEAEVTIAKLATQKAMNPDVKAFAQQMVKDHTDFIAKLDRFDQTSGSRGAGVNIRTETRADTSTAPSEKADSAKRDSTKPRTESATDSPKTGAEVRINVNRSEVTAQTAGRGNDIADQLLRINKEITQRCVAAAQRELSAKQGKEFDQCFMFMQVGGHMKMAEVLAVLNTHASPELQQILDEGLQTTQQHLEHAKQLAKKLDESSVTASDRPATDRAGTEKTARKKEKDSAK